MRSLSLAIPSEGAEGQVSRRAYLPVFSFSRSLVLSFSRSLVFPSSRPVVRAQGPNVGKSDSIHRGVFVSPVLF